jgi:phosphoribosylglycinamide formyltransferase-1
MNRRLAILISGRGSNLQSILAATIEGRLEATVSMVISDRGEAAGLERAREAGIDARWMDPRDYADRTRYDDAIAGVLSAIQVDLLCLAGFMRVLGDPVLDAFPRRVLNIHPSLLPAFPGLHAQRRALEHGVRVAGATVHFVTKELDSGPIILQAAVPVFDNDTVEMLSARILVEEHRIYPEAIGLVLNGGWSIEGRRFLRSKS